MGSFEFDCLKRKCVSCPKLLRVSQIANGYSSYCDYYDVLQFAEKLIKIPEFFAENWNYPKNLGYSAFLTFPWKICHYSVEITLDSPKIE